MNNPHTSLPSLRALTALKLLAETGSISKTADQMHVTHGAVSHMIRALEANINVSLTKRAGRGVILTGQGQQYVEKIAPALEQISQAAIQLTAASGSLRLNAASGFAANWLSHHIGEFRAQYPDISLTLKTPRTYGDLGDQNDDLYITFARPQNVPNHAQILLSVEFFPVCAPKIATQLSTPADILQYELLHLITPNDWPRWCQAAGLNAPKSANILFDDMQSMLSAAIAAQGICLGDQLTCGRALREGQLQRPFTASLETDRAYYIVEGKRGTSPAASALRDWLISHFSN